MSSVTPKTMLLFEYRPLLRKKNLFLFKKHAEGKNKFLKLINGLLFFNAILDNRANFFDRRKK